MKEITPLAIKLDNVSVDYTSVTPDRLFKGGFTTRAVHNFSFTFEPNTIYGFLGRNGAGKTSLLSVMAGYKQAATGSVTINGEDIFENPNFDSHIIFIYQRNLSEESLRVHDYVANASLFRPNFDMQYANDLLKRYGINQKKKLKSLSKGQQSMVTTTIGLAANCPITIFDEAYLGMDAPARDIFYKEILKQQEQNPRTFIISTHHISEVEYLFDDVVIINQGRLVEGLKYDPADRQNLNDAFIKATQSDQAE